MSLSRLRVCGPIVRRMWSGTTLGSTTSNLFIRTGASTTGISTVEGFSVQTAGCNFRLWRIVGAFLAAAAQTCVMTPRVNGISQSFTVSVGAAAGVVSTDATSPASVLSTDSLSFMVKFSVADGSTAHPRGLLIGDLDTSF